MSKFATGIDNVVKLALDGEIERLSVPSITQFFELESARVHRREFLRQFAVAAAVPLEKIGVPAIDDG